MRNRSRFGWQLWSVSVLGAALTLGCDGGSTEDGADAGAGGEAAGGSGSGGEAAGGNGSGGGGGSPSCETPAFTEDVSACTPAATDYAPGNPGANGWPACVSDSNTWTLSGDGPPAAIARVTAFDSMATKLWKKASAPTPADFLAARDEYSVDEGIASRVGRRQDVSYDEVPGDDKFACAQEGIPEQYPDRCAGPAKIKPIIDDAFVKGADGDQPIVQAARIEAGLLWFFYLSMTSEVWTCSFDDISDCDAAAGYYTGLTDRDTPKGFATYVAALGPATHQRIWDALFAERCWRDQEDPAAPTLNHPELYELAAAQLQKAALRGQALILRDRIGQIQCSTGEEQTAAIEFVKILGGFIDHQAAGFDAAGAADLKAYTDSPTADPDAIGAAQAAIDAIFDCP